MKINIILKLVGLFHFIIGVVLLIVIIMPNNIASNIFHVPSSEHVIWLKTPMTVVASMNLGLGLLLVISSAIKNTQSAKLVLLGEVFMMFFILLGALFNDFSSFTATGPPLILYLMIIFNLLFCLYVYFK